MLSKRPVLRFTAALFFHVMHFHFVILISYFVSIINGQTWSSWSTCESIPNCFRRRVLACDDGEGIRCARDELHEQRAVSFSINGCDGICIANKSQRESSTVSHLTLSSNHMVWFVIKLP